MAREVNIPFAGFYESKWSGLLDHAVEREAEYRTEREASHHYEGDGYEPDPELRLDSFYGETLWEHIDYKAAYADIARDYASAFNRQLSDALGFELGLEFVTMTSPRFYNFETDRLFCSISDETARKLFANSKEQDGHATFRRLIEERHTSRSGFISFYSTDADHWFADDAPDFYDHNELGTLLRACLALTGEEDDLEWRIFEGLSEADYEYVDQHCNWKTFEDACELRREELRAEVAAERGLEVEALPYRCPDTPDLFAGL